MSEIDRKRDSFCPLMRLSAIAIGLTCLAVTIHGSQDSPSAAPPATTVLSKNQSDRGVSFFPAAAMRNRTSQVSESLLGEPNSVFTEERPAHSSQVRRITLQQVKQSADQIPTPISRLGQLEVQVAKQHRLAVQADYFPKFGATFSNLHFSDFLGQLITIRGQGTALFQFPAQIINQDQTTAALTFAQPITPLFQVRQAVRIARADERIAMAKAGGAVTKDRRDRGAQLEESYLKLLIAQRRLLSAELTLRVSEGQPPYGGAAIDTVHAEVRNPEMVEARRFRETAATEVRELTIMLNRRLGWPDDTELELVPPDPLVESITLKEVSDKSVANSPAVIEAEQNVVKARAASALAKLAYVPTVATVGGYVFQNAFPAVLSNFGYGGVIASYNIFDFGKRERGVKEAHAQLEIAEILLQMTKAKTALDLKDSYLKLERSRQLSKVALKMGLSMAVVLRASSNPDTTEVKAARAEAELQILEADLAHRQAFNHLMALIDIQ